MSHAVAHLDERVRVVPPGKPVLVDQAGVLADFRDNRVSRQIDFGDSFEIKGTRHRVWNGCQGGSRLRGGPCLTARFRHESERHEQPSQA